MCFPILLFVKFWKSKSLGRKIYILILWKFNDNEGLSRKLDLSEGGSSCVREGFLRPECHFKPPLSHISVTLLFEFCCEILYLVPLLLCWVLLHEHSTGNLLHSFANQMWIWQTRVTHPSKSQPERLDW